jgi:lysophospholipase L1-like esterase
VTLSSIVLLEIVLQTAARFVAEGPADLGAQVDPTAVRVLAVGDSWVEGAEAPEGEGFVDHLARELPSVAGDTPIQLFNLGRTGANSAYVALTVMDEAPRIEPALILVLVGQNNATTFYRVAELEQRIGISETHSERWYDSFRTVKLGRIILATIRGGSDYAEGIEVIEIPELEYDVESHAVLRAPLLEDDAGQGYYLRKVQDDPPPSGNELRDLAWKTLYATARRDLDVASAAASRLTQELGWPAEAAAPAAPRAADDTELLARFAMMRLARQQRQWRALRFHAGAAQGYEPRGAISDLMAAEAHLLAGDWEGANQYLSAAHNRAPGFLDTIDLAERFPEQARDPAAYEAMEWPPAAPSLPAYEEAERMRYAERLPELAVAPYRAWTDRRRDDLPIRVDLAIWLLENGRYDEANDLIGTPRGRETRLALPTSTDPELWRFLVARALSTGDRVHALDTVEAALDRAAPADHAGLLKEMTRALSAHASCERLGPIADAWFQARGDANAYAHFVSPCMDGAAAADRLTTLRGAWGPLGRETAFTALVRAGRKPFELLYRDLDLVLAEAAGIGADVVVLNYPNPSEDHTALREIIATYAASREVGYIDLWARFDEKFTREEWAERIAENGHCNALGYREMADGVLQWLSAEGTLSGGRAGQ